MAQTPGSSVGSPAKRNEGMALRLLLRIPEILIAVLLAILIMFLIVSVLSRYVFDIGLAWSDEAARLMFIWLVFVGFAVGVRHRANVGVEWLVDKISPRRRRILTIAQDVIIVAFSLFFTWESYETVRFSLLQRMPALDITIAWLYLSCLVAGVLMVVYGIANLVETLRARHPRSHEGAAGSTRPMDR